MTAERSGGGGGTSTTAPLRPDVQRFYVAQFREHWVVRDAADALLRIVFTGSWVECDEDASRRNAG